MGQKTKLPTEIDKDLLIRIIGLLLALTMLPVFVFRGRPVWWLLVVALILFVCLAVLSLSLPRLTKGEIYTNEVMQDFYKDHLKRCVQDNWHYIFDCLIFSPKFTAGIFSSEEEKDSCLSKGLLFELFIADLLFVAGFKNVSLTYSNGKPDHGADIVAMYGTKRCIFQCRQSRITADEMQGLEYSKNRYAADAVFYVSPNGFTNDALKRAKEMRINTLGPQEINALISGDYWELKPHYGLWRISQLNAFGKIGRAGVLKMKVDVNLDYDNAVLNKTLPQWVHSKRYEALNDSRIETR